MCSTPALSIPITASPFHPAVTAFMLPTRSSRRRQRCSTVDFGCIYLGAGPKYISGSRPNEFTCTVAGVPCLVSVLLLDFSNLCLMACSNHHVCAAIKDSHSSAAVEHCIQVSTCCERQRGSRALCVKSTNMLDSHCLVEISPDPYQLFQHGLLEGVFIWQLAA